eukprot:NODE_5019_length_710_cov_6.607204_g4856_i0.p1 GENE.NODE_5019_length_710_cov_6.607204_g4856_i0~~NODE_5019_length_710_cov_6.607204_g4856_i0.p1  ORF type:complete len:229 (+),score=49.99 NODE_5019_length_710_cov_6.607204_g4856_i0:3-689(+)
MWRCPFLLQAQAARKVFLLTPKRKVKRQPIFLASPKTPFCYTEHNRIAVSGENGTLMYRTPPLFQIARDGDSISLDFVFLVELLRLIKAPQIPASSLVDAHYRHHVWLRRVVQSISFLDTKKIMLVGRAFRMSYKHGQTTNSFVIRAGKSHDDYFSLPFHYQTALEKDINGNHVLSVSCMPIYTRERDLWLEQLRLVKKTERYTGKGFVILNSPDPIKLTGKGPDFLK